MGFSLISKGHKMERLKRLARADRYNLHILGKITLEKDDGTQGESYICNTINVSISGALVETGSQIPVGALLKYSFSIPGFNLPVSLIGEVVRGESPAAKEEKEEKEEKRKLTRYGIIFLDMKDDDKLALQSYLAQARNTPTEPEPEPEPAK